MRRLYSVTTEVYSESDPKKVLFHKTVQVKADSNHGARYRAWTDVQGLGFAPQRSIGCRRIA